MQTLCHCRTFSAPKRQNDYSEWSPLAGANKRRAHRLYSGISTCAITPGCAATIVLWSCRRAFHRGRRCAVASRLTPTQQQASARWVSGRPQERSRHFEPTIDSAAIQFDVRHETEMTFPNSQLSIERLQWAEEFAMEARVIDSKLT